VISAFQLFSLSAFRISLSSFAFSFSAFSSPLVGTLQSDPAKAEAHYAIGIRVATVQVTWDRCEPAAGKFDADYLAGIRDQIATFRRAGMQVALDLGIQYPPRWLFDLPNSRFVNQFGDVYDDPAPGANGLNSVFNREIRDRIAAYYERVLRAVGSDVAIVRLGGGYFGELSYPASKWKDHDNCYWAFDAIAQGSAAGLPDGIKPCPRPGWKPGEPSPDHAAAAAFVDWYLDSLKNFHNWQIETARRFFKGRLAMLYPSWGIRPGQLDDAISTDLAGTTSAEVNGETQRGFDFARFIAGITDPKVIVQCTWVDPPFGNDASQNPADWTPAHFLAELARKNPRRLAVWGENTGNADAAAMERSFARAREFGLEALIWAFEPELYDGKHATIEDLTRHIREQGTIKAAP
jgi:hypothetical protein